VQQGSVVEVLRAFLRLGLTSFGGPVAHLGYFREEFVVRRRWLDDRAYADLVGLREVRALTKSLRQV
jgi:chromate transporter